MAVNEWKICFSVQGFKAVRRFHPGMCNKYRLWDGSSNRP